MNPWSRVLRIESSVIQISKLILKKRFLKHECTHGNMSAADLNFARMLRLDSCGWNHFALIISLGAKSRIIEPIEYNEKQNKLTTARLQSHQSRHL